MATEAEEVNPRKTDESTASAGSDKGHPAWKQLVAACLLVGGAQGFIFNIIGIYISPICQQLGFSTGLFGTAISIGAVGTLVMLGMAGKLLKKYKLRPLLVTLIIIGAACYIAMAFSRSLILFYILFFVAYGALAIPGYVTGPMLVGQWFQKKKGMAMGIMMLCGSLCAVVGNLIGGNLLGSGGYSATFPIIGGIALALMLVGAFMAVISPAAVGLKPYGADEETGGEGREQATASSEEIGIPSGKAIKSLAFILLFIAMMFMVAGGSFSTLTTAFAINVGYTVEQGTRFAACMTIGALLGSLLIGMLNDRLGGKSLTVIIFVGIAAGALGIMAVSGSSVGLLVALCIFFGFFTAGSGIQLPLLVGKVFGQKDYASILAKLQMSMMLGGMLAVPIFGFIYDATGSYSGALILIAVLSVLGILFVFIIFGSARKLWKKTLDIDMPK